MVYRGFETVLRTLIRQHYHVRSENLQEVADMHRNLLDAIAKKDELSAMETARQILTQGISALQERYE